MTYKHLTETERDRLTVLRSKGRTLREIGRLLGRSPASLCRELRRNGLGKRYYPHHAQKRASKREHESHRRPRLKNHALRLQVEQMLKEGWSPEIVAGRLTRQQGYQVTSHEAIYQWIYAEAPHLIGYLVRSHPKRWSRRYSRKRRGLQIPGRISVRERPAVVHSRRQPGHWETDLLVGPSAAALQVTVERQTRYTRLERLPRKTATAARQALIGVLAALPESLRRSLTYDNGPENAEHLQLAAQIGLRSYFCEPYHSWEKGTVENTNGLVRRFLPKRTDLATLSEARIREIESWLNNRPRKCLGFQTPAEAFNSLVALAA